MDRAIQAGTSAGTVAQAQANSRPVTRRWRVVAVIGVAALGWLVPGRWSAEGIARTHFVAVHQGLAGSVAVEAIRPAFPPFYEVRVSGFVRHPDWYSGNWYRMTLWVEPASGVTFLVSWD